jgi:hypothetical protein
MQSQKLHLRYKGREGKILILSETMNTPVPKITQMQKESRKGSDAIFYSFFTKKDLQNDDVIRGWPGKVGKYGVRSFSVIERLLIFLYLCVVIAEVRLVNELLGSSSFLRDCLFVTFFTHRKMFHLKRMHAPSEKEWTNKEKHIPVLLTGIVFFFLDMFEQIPINESINPQVLQKIGLHALSGNQ